MLSLLIDASPQPLSWAGPVPVPPPPVTRTGRIAPRTFDLRKGKEGWLANLASGLPNMNPSPRPHPHGAAAYRSMLGHALSDGKIVGEEAQRLALLATRAAFTQNTVRGVHEQVLMEARSRAEADGVVTSAELRELERAAANLGVGHVIQDLLYVVEQEKARKNGPLKGWRIIPVGESASVTAVTDHAVSQGAVVGVNVTKTVRLVIAEPGTDDPKIDRARTAGIRVAAPAEAWDLFKAAIEKAERGLFDDGTGAAVAAGLGTERENEPWQSFWRPRELSDAEYHARFIAPHEHRRPPAPVPPVPPVTKGNGCAAGAVLLLAGLGAAATAAAAAVWPL